jgi:hypothetical protein
MAGYQNTQSNSNYHGEFKIGSFPKNLNTQSGKSQAYHGPTPMFRTMSSKSKEAVLGESRSITEKKMLLNQYKPNYVVVEEEVQKKAGKKGKAKRVSPRDGSPKMPGVGQQVVTLQVQSRTVDASNNMHARYPSTKIPHVGLMALSSSKELVMERMAPGGGHLADQVSQAVAARKEERKEKTLQKFRFRTHYGGAQLGSNHQPHLGTLPFIESASNSRESEASGPQGAPLDAQLNLNSASRLSLRTINEGEDTARYRLQDSGGRGSSTVGAHEQMNTFDHRGKGH